MLASYSQLNKSPTKQAWGFPQAKRFNKEKIDGSQQFYDLPRMVEKRGAVIGKGKRYHMSPNHYMIDRTFSKKSGFTMGVSREDHQKMESSGILQTFRNEAPGPAQYIPKSELSNIKYSIAGKHNKKNRSNTPGPGLYENKEQINPDGKYHNSNYKKISLRQIVFNHAIADRFGNVILNKFVPGPGSYDLSKISVGSHQKFQISNYKNPRSISFDKQMNKSSSHIKTNPIGPGSYEIPSEFGFVQRQRIKSVTKY